MKEKNRKDIRNGKTERMPEREYREENRRC